MNIQGANLLSLLSGSEGPDKLPQALAGLNGAQADFAAAFMEQLQLLQNPAVGDVNVAAPDISSIQEWVDAAQGGDVAPDFPGFADLLGKNLPLVDKAATDIDLQDTLQTLAGVLQQLQQLETGTEPLMSGLPSGEEAEFQQPLTDSDQEVTDSVAAVNDAVITMNVPVTEVRETVEPNIDEAEPVVLPERSAKPAALLQQQAEKQNIQLSDTVASSDNSGTDFNRSISAMLNREGGNDKPQQDKSNLAFKADSLLSQIENQGDGENLGKSLPGVAAEIAKLNHAVRGDTQTAPVPQPTMLKSFADPAWGKELGEKLIWMHKQEIPSVELRLNPAHLGPVLVKIDVNQDQASVAFTAQHLAVKEALEAAIPRLREMLGGQQINLMDVNVSQQQSDQRQAAHDFFQMASGQGRRGQDDFDANGNGPHNEAQDLVDEIEAGRAVASNGLLSLFA